MTTTFEILRTLIVEEIGLDADEITPDASFNTDLNCDSLDRIHLFMAAEEAFDIEIDDLEAEAIDMVGEAVALIDRKLAASLAAKTA